MTRLIYLRFIRQQTFFSILFSAFLAVAGVLGATASIANVDVAGQCTLADFQTSDTEDESDTESADDEEEDEEPDCD